MRRFIKPKNLIIFFGFFLIAHLLTLSLCFCSGVTDNWGVNGDLRISLSGIYERQVEDKDADLRESLYYEFGSSQDKFHFEFYFSANQDLDGKKNSLDINDRRGKEEYYFHLAYVNFNFNKFKLWLGRMYSQDYYDFHFDGGNFLLNPARNLGIKVFGGIPVHLYDTSHSGDWMVGGAIDWKVNQTVQLGALYAVVNDRIVLEKSGQYDQNDEVLQFATAFSYGKWNFEPRLIGLNGKFQKTENKFTFTHLQKSLTIQLNYNQLFNEQDFVASDIGEFTAFLPDFNITYYPYYEASATVSKGISEKISLDGGVQLRKMDKEDIETTFNHSFVKYFLNFSFSKVITEKTNFLIGGTGWQNLGESKNFVGGAIASINQQIGRFFWVEMGTDFSRYRYDPTSLTEQENVYSYFANFRFKANYMELKLEYAYCDSDVEDFQMARLQSIFKL